MTAVSSPGAARVAFDDWGWRYAGRDAWAVRGLDLVLEPGERVAVVGPSGAGKSTVLRAVAAVLADEPDPDDDTAAAVQGSVLVDGADPRAVRGRVGLVMQDPEAHTVMSRIGDDVAFGCENTGVPRAETWERVRHALGVVGLDLPLDRSTSRLSGGQRQRLALAGVLAMRPGVLVLDEPCANLDPEGVAQVHDAVRALLDSTGATMLVVEHRIGTWLDLVDRLVLLEPGGGVVADGAPATVLAEHGAALTAAGVWVPGAEPARGSSRAGGRPGAPTAGAGRPVAPTAAGRPVASSSERAGGSAPGAPVAGGAFRPLDEGAGLLEARGLATARGGILGRAGSTPSAATSTSGSGADGSSRSPARTASASRRSASPSPDSCAPRAARCVRRPTSPVRPETRRSGGRADSSPPASARCSRTPDTSSSHGASARNSPPARTRSASTTRTHGWRTSSTPSGCGTSPTPTPSRSPAASSGGSRSEQSSPRGRPWSCWTNPRRGRTARRGRPWSTCSARWPTPGRPSWW